MTYNTHNHFFFIFLGFTSVLKNDCKRIKGFCLLDLKKSAALGAASLAAKDVKFTLPMDYSANATILYQEATRLSINKLAKIN
jgi:hypothetical protein